MLHTYILEGEQQVLWLIILALAIVSMIAYNLRVTGLKKDLEAEIKKNMGNHETLKIKYEIENTLSQISSLLAFSDDPDEKIEESLALLGRLFNADRAYVFKLRDHGKIMDNTHEWCAEGVRPQKDNLQSIPSSEYAWWMKKTYNDEMIRIRYLDELPPEAEAEKELLEKQEIESLIVLPFKIEGEPAGFIGFDNVEETRDWNLDDIKVLKTFANILGMAFRKKAISKELELEKEQLLSVFDSIDEPICVSDICTHEILYVNKYLNTKFNENVIGKNCYKIIYGFDEPCVFCTDVTLVNDHSKVQKCEYHNPLTSRDYIISARSIKWTNGCDARLEIAHDITEIRATERALREKEENFKKLIDNSPLPIGIMNSNSHFEYWNKKFTEMFGYTSQDMPTIKEWWELFYPDSQHRKEAFDEWVHFLEHKDTGFSERTVICKDGTEKQIAFYFTRTNNSIVFILNDLTVLKRTEEALKVDESCLESLYELSQMNILSTEQIKSFALEEGMELTKSDIAILVFFNEREQRFIADTYPSDLFARNKINEEIFISLLESSDMWLRLRESRKPVFFDEAQNTDQSPGFALFRKLSVDSFLAVPILSENKTAGFVIVANKDGEYSFSDARQLSLIVQMMGRIILLKRWGDELRKYNRELMDINKELSRANEELHSLDELKNNFLSTINHELRTPLISIMGFSELVGDEILGPLSKEQKKAMDVVNRNAGQLKRLIDSLLFMSSLEAREYRYDLARLKLEPIIEKALSLIEMENTDKKLILSNVLSDDMNFVNGDPNYLSEMFIHLIDNAFKFTQSGGRVCIYGYNEEDMIHIIVEDTGIGIPEPKIMRTFDSFHQLDGSLSRKYGGAGIGLNICKRIAEDHGGKLWIESEEGVGTKVHITLPAIQEHTDPSLSGSS
ncbi:MAG: ATP-binding protein [Methanolobus sp.]|nr:ATP-binding protein [Methanolobus sp.]